MEGSGGAIKIDYGFLPRIIFTSRNHLYFVDRSTFTFHFKCFGEGRNICRLGWQVVRPSVCSTLVRHVIFNVCRLPASHCFQGV